MKSLPSQPRYARNGWRYDRRVTATMVEDMLFDPILASKVLLNLRIPPHEELRILAMWVTHLMSDDSGFSTGKSFTHAIISALRSILMSGRISGILSGTFRQGQLIFQNFDRWYESSSIFRNCIKHYNNKPRLVHGGGLWQATYINGSETRVLPPNFAEESVNLRSERWHDGYFDEWVVYKNLSSLTSTIFGRVTATNEHRDCPVRQNHIHLSSTPGFEHQPPYNLIKKIQANTEKEPENYKRFTCNYRHVPRKKKWEFLVNLRVIHSMQTMNPPGIVKSEIDGFWQKDSMSYYSSGTITDCRPKNLTALLGRMSQYDVYLAAFDYARGGGEQNQGSADDFSVTVLRVPDGMRLPKESMDATVAVHAFTRRYNNISSKNAAGVIHEIDQAFGLSMIMYDPGGGGLFVKDDLKSPEQSIKGVDQAVVPLIEMQDNSGTIGRRILVPFKRGQFHIDLMWGKMSSDSVLVNMMHSKFKAAMEAELKRIMLAPPWEGWDQFGGNREWDPDSMRELLSKHQGMSELNRAKAEMDLAVSQLIQVDVERDENGVPKVDRHNMMRFGSKFKKDSAYSLIYAYTVFLVWCHMSKMGFQTEESDNSSGLPFAAGAI